MASPVAPRTVAAAPAEPRCRRESGSWPSTRRRRFICASRTRLRVEITERRAELERLVRDRVDMELQAIADEIVAEQISSGNGDGQHQGLVAGEAVVERDSRRERRGGRAAAPAVSPRFIGEPSARAPSGRRARDRAASRRASTPATDDDDPHQAVAANTIVSGPAGDLPGDRTARRRARPGSCC